jgi:hypothetical protein
MPIVSRRANLLERSIQGLPSSDQQVQSLVATARRIPALTSASCAPRDEFVIALGLRLRAEALTMPARAADSADSRVLPTSTATVTRRTTRPMVPVIGKGMRITAGATASLLLIGVLVGVTSRSALPGGVLYPVKQVLNSASVQLAGSDFDRGATQLSQAQADIGDARSLVERDRAKADPASVNQALLSAYDSAKAGQRALLGDFDHTRSTQALTALQDFAVRAMPQLNVLRLQVPAASTPQVDALIALLHQTRTTLTRKIAQCGQPCDSLGGVHPGVRPSSAPSTGMPLAPPSGNLRIPGLPTGGLPVVGRVPAVTGPGGVVVGPAVPPLTIPRGANLSPVTVGPLTVKPPPIVIPPLPHLAPLIPTPTLPPPPTGLPGLP